MRGINASYKQIKASHQKVTSEELCTLFYYAGVRFDFDEEIET